MWLMIILAALWLWSLRIWARSQLGVQWWRGVVTGGSCSLVAEHWRIKPMALGSIPGGSTFLSCPFAISEVFGHNDLIQRSLIRPGLIGLWIKLIGVPTIRLPAVISLRISMITYICTHLCTYVYSYIRSAYACVSTHAVCMRTDEWLLVSTISLQHMCHTLCIIQH